MKYVLILVLSSNYYGQSITNAEFATKETCEAAGELAKTKLKVWGGSDVRFVCAKK